MPCCCGHISCLCGIPCLCDASACKCRGCAEAVGRVCKMCNKAFYYERLVLKQTREEEICDCFMVKSTVRDKTSAFPSFETYGTYSQPFPSTSNNFQHQNTEQLAQNNPHIFDSSSVQSNYPCGSEYFGSIPFDPSGQGHAFFPQQENAQSVNPNMEYSENNITGQPEFNYTDNIQESANIQNSNHTNFENSAHQAPEQMEENSAPTSSDFPKQPNEEQDHPSQRKQKFYKIPGETHPVFINIRSALNPTAVISECRAATLKWLRTVPDRKVEIQSCDLITSIIE